jgi:predicted DNA binding protein
MGIIVECSVSSPDIALCEATSGVPSVELELTDIFATDPEQPVMFFWVKGGDVDAFHDVLVDDWTMTDVELYTDLENLRLYRAVLSPEVDTVLYPVWVEAGGSRLHSTCQNGVWRNRMRFPDRESFAGVRRWCLDNDIEFTLHRIYTETTDGGGENETSLSPPQARTLELAYETGYYDIPQGTTATEIAAELGISQQAVSERLHRAHAALIEEYILDEQGLDAGIE